MLSACLNIFRVIVLKNGCLTAVHMPCYPHGKEYYVYKNMRVCDV